MSTLTTVCVLILAGFVALVESTCVNCNGKCCGKYRTCTTSCNGYSCDKDSECGDGCCVVGYCTEPCVTEFSKLYIGLITGGSVFLLTTLASCMFTCIRRRYCRKKNKNEDNVIVNLQAPMGMPGNPHPNQPDQMANYHVSTSPMASSAIMNQGYQAQLGKTGRANRW